MAELPPMQRHGKGCTTTNNSYVQQAQTFREAHAACGPDRLAYTIWLPRGLDIASVTVRCACGAQTRIACTPYVARTSLSALWLAGGQVREITAPEGLE